MSKVIEREQRFNQVQLTLSYCAYREKGMPKKAAYKLSLQKLQKQVKAAPHERE
jgi:hypothetical protein